MLIKLVLIILDYYLIINEKKYLYLLTKDNNNTIEKLKNELFNFFNRIFINFNRDFNI